MSHNPIGLHIQAGGLGDRAGLIEHCKRASYKTLTVLDDFTLAMDLTDALPEAIVVFRQFGWEPAPPNSDQLGQLLSAQPQHDPRWKRVVINVNCEQGNDPDRCKMYADMIEEASALGVRLCVGNFSSGSIKSGWTETNEWLTVSSPLLRALAQHPEHYLGVHEYSMFFPWAASNDEGAPGREHWDQRPTKIDWDKPQWHIGRVMGAINACQALGIKPPRILITECLLDHMNDIAAAFGPEDEQHKLRGWRTLDQRWTEWFPGRDAGELYAQMCIWAWETVYKPLKVVEGMHVFSFADASGNWADFRVDNSPSYLGVMEQYRSEAGTADSPVVIHHHPEPQPAANTVDLLDYMRGDGRLYQLKHDIDGHQGVQTVQTQSDAHNPEVFYHVKDGQWERIYADKHFIYRETDTSEAADLFYTQTSKGLPGALWAKRFMKIGEKTRRNPLVIHFHKPDCSETARTEGVDFLQLLDVKASHTFESGIKLNDVLVLGWLVDGTLREKYFYAKKFGLVAWDGMERGGSFISQEHVNGQAMQREFIACLGLDAPGNLFHAPAPALQQPHMIVPASGHVRVKDTGDEGLNLRTQAAVIDDDTLIATIMKDTVLKVFERDGDWLHVVLFTSADYVDGRVTGWLNGDFTEAHTPVQSLSAAPLTPQGDDMTLMRVIQSDGKGLNVRVKPQVNSLTRIAAVKEGALVNVLQIVNGWAQILVFSDDHFVNGRITGWVSADFLEALEDDTDNMVDMGDSQPRAVIDHPGDFRIVDIVDTLPRHATKKYKMRDVNKLVAHVVHHTATRADVTPEAVANFHINRRDWPGIAYTFFIAADGTIFQTNHLETKSFATADQNHRYLSTVLAGSFINGHHPTNEQIASLRWLHHHWLPSQLGRALPLLGHKEGDDQHTDCPGNSWDWHALIEPE